MNKEETESAVIQLNDELKRHLRQHECEHETILMLIDNDGYVHRKAKCEKCDKTLTRVAAGYRYEHKIKNIYKWFVK